MDLSQMGENTRSVRAGERLDRRVGGVTTPIHTAAAYMAADAAPIPFPPELERP